MTLPASKITAVDQRFLRRWDRWHRRGPLLYFLWVTVGFLIGASLIASIYGNLAEHGVHVWEWDHFLQRSNWLHFLGAVFGSTTAALTRFDKSEERFGRLTKV